ncbi:hypothetical protein CPLU01_01590 [Colletotrichum plurivorum]|uniref:Uncharacterized protein n=1 Tax=Colletotrichum plurivorum TaxID=2175906 RepID=A0A8H6NNL8_9PEZI|nr:hypothetical protein CPLU01_01590 [Colletotrichum plurivorum]
MRPGHPSFALPRDGQPDIYGSGAEGEMSLEGHNQLSQHTSMSESSKRLVTSQPPATTPAPNIRVRDDDVATKRKATIPSKLCGYFYLSSDLGLRTRTCDVAGVGCETWSSWLGCDERPFTACYDGSAAQCASGKSTGSQTLCCQTRTGWTGKCQTFLRVEEDHATKTLLGCREEGTNWDATIFLHTTTPSSMSATPTSAPAVYPGNSLASSTNTASPTVSSNNDPGTPVGAIVGGVIGGCVVLALGGCIIAWIILRRRRRAASTHHFWSYKTPKLQVSRPNFHHHHHQQQPQQQHFEAYEEEFNSRIISPVSPAGPQIVIDSPTSPVRRVSEPADSPVARDSMHKERHRGYVGTSTKPAELD